MASDESGTVTIVLIAAGCIVGVLLISFAAYMITQKCKNNHNSGNAMDQGERAFLLGINAEGGGGFVGTGNGKERWPFGDLDRSGVARILKWMKEIVMPSLNELDEGSFTQYEHQGLLGEDDHLETPTGRYSPRVSNVGSTREDIGGSGTPNYVRLDGERDD